VEPDRVFVNLFPDEVKTGMAEHEDVAVFCTVIIMLTQDDDAGKYGSLFICSGDLVVFRNIRHELPACIRRRKRLTINLFF
jgi:hypothetical protein